LSRQEKNDRQVKNKFLQVLCFQGLVVFKIQIQI